MLWMCQRDAIRRDWTGRTSHSCWEGSRGSRQRSRARGGERDRTDSSRSVVVPLSLVIVMTARGSVIVRGRVKRGRERAIGSGSVLRGATKRSGVLLDARDELQTTGYRRC